MDLRNAVTWAEYNLRHFGNKHCRPSKVKQLESAGIRQNFYPNLGLVFVHIPKTAGTTLHEHFSKLDDSCRSPSACESAVRSLENKFFMQKHLKASAYRSTVGAEAWDSIYSFTLVRNPWDILVSSYHWWLQKGPRFNSHLRDALRVREMSDFEAFLRSDLALGNIAGNLGELESWFRQDGQDIVTHIGKFEDMDQEISKILTHLNISETNIRLPHRNKGNRSDYRTYYNSSTKDMVAETYSYIIERFEYEF